MVSLGIWSPIFAKFVPGLGVLKRAEFMSFGILVWMWLLEDSGF